MKYLLILVILLSGCVYINKSHCHQDLCHSDHYETIGYSADWGSGDINCEVTDFGRIYKCTIVRPCMSVGNNPCGYK